MVEGIPVDPEARSTEQQATWVLAYLLDWHRREDKAAWWEYFRLAALTPEELTDERAALSGLELIATVDETARGITANSHKVIRNLLDKVIEAAEEAGLDLRCVQKPKEMEPDKPRLTFAKDNNALLSALASGRCQVAGATHFLWARADAQERLDVLVVDEAAQMSLANVVAVAPSAERLVLLDKFQGQEAPIAIYSTATSSHADAPRGMEFLYSANRFNVATSRAKCVAILVASPQIFEAECRLSLIHI